jgi:hypothetical protein
MKFVKPLGPEKLPTMAESFEFFNYSHAALISTSSRHICIKFQSFPWNREMRVQTKT